MEHMSEHGTSSTIDGESDLAVCSKQEKRPTVKTVLLTVQTEVGVKAARLRAEGR